MKRPLPWLLLAAALLGTFVFFRQSVRSSLNVEPNAGEVIERATER